MIAGGDGGSGVTVKKADLLEELRKNRSVHREAFLEAQAGYREEVIKELDAMLKDARDGKHIRRTVTLVEPQDHTRDYDRVVRMLEMCTKEEVFVSEGEFQQYVQDDWSWKQQFLAQTASYVKH